VLQLRSVEYARNHGVRIHCRSSFLDEPGTFVVTEQETMEQPLVTAVTHSTDEARVTLTGLPDRPGVAGRVLTAMAEANVNVDMIIQNEPETEGHGADMSFTVPRADLVIASEKLEAIKDELGFGEVVTDPTMGQVSLVGAGMKSHPGVAAKAFSVIGEAGINIEMISTSPIKISCVISQDDVEKAVVQLATAFDLDKDAVRHEDVQGVHRRSEEWAPRFVEAGAVVVDNSSFWRMHDDVPLVVSEVNPDALDSHRGIVANPNCSTMQMVVALKPILDAVGIERLVISTYQSVSGTGQRAVEELENQTRSIIEAKELATPSVYPHRIAFNVLPQVESFKEGDDYTTEERKMTGETRKILGAPEIGVSATCARVPVYTGHSESINVQTRDPLSPEECRALLAEAPGVIVLDNPADGIYPLAIDAAGRDEVFVGRIRRDPSHERCLNLWVVGDNLRKGAATNAVQVAELLHERNLLPAARAA
jgi:aspartate-semialdehyde dehydrogenase